MEGYSFDTQTIHAGIDVGARAYNTVAPPLFPTAAFTFDSAEHIENIMAMKAKAFIYSRVGNPTVDLLEKRLAALEGGIGALATSSGSSAILTLTLALCKSGDEVIVPYKLYGGTAHAFGHWYPRLGIKGVFVDSLDAADFEKAITEKTKFIMIEAVSNPALEILDVPKFAEVAHKHGIPLVVDSTFTAGYLMRPLELGADIVVTSCTKWLCGHGTVLGGAVIDSGKFKFTGEKWPEFDNPLPGYGPLVLSQKCGPMSLLVKMRMETLRESGGCLSPFSAWQILQGIETLSVRMDRHTNNALALAQYLDKHEAVEWVLHPGLPHHPSYEVAKRIMPKGTGGMVSFAMKNDSTGDRGRAVVDATKLAYHCGNVGDVRTLVVNPAFTIQRQLPKETLLKNGSPDNLIRVSVGLEAIEDIIKDFEQAIASVLRSASA